MNVIERHNDMMMQHHKDGIHYLTIFEYNLALDAYGKAAHEAHVCMQLTMLHDPLDEARVSYYTVRRATLDGIVQALCVILMQMNYGITM